MGESPPCASCCTASRLRSGSHPSAAHCNCLPSWPPLCLPELLHLRDASGQCPSAPPVVHSVCPDTRTAECGCLAPLHQPPRRLKVGASATVPKKAWCQWGSRTGFALALCTLPPGRAHRASSQSLNWPATLLPNYLEAAWFLLCVAGEQSSTRPALQLCAAGCACCPAQECARLIHRRCLPRHLGSIIDCALAASAALLPWSKHLY